MSRKAIIIFHPQIDFCSGGALEQPDANQKIAAWHAALGNYDLVIGYQNMHPTDHVSFAANHMWQHPGKVVRFEKQDITLQIAHCVKGSFGAFFHKPFTEADFDQILFTGEEAFAENDQFFSNQENRHRLSDLLHQHKIEEFTVVGFAHTSIVEDAERVLEDEGFGKNSFSVIEGNG